MTSTTQSINLFKIALITLALILASAALMYFTFGIDNYTGLLKNIGLSLSILISSASVFFIIVLKKEKAQIQKGWLLYVSFVCSVIYMFLTSLYKEYLTK